MIIRYVHADFAAEIGLARVLVPIAEEQVDSWLLVEVEDGRAYGTSGGGEWFTERRLTAINEGDEVQVHVEMTDPELNSLLLANETFTIRLTGVTWHSEAPSWTVDGFDVGEYWIESDGWEWVGDPPELLSYIRELEKENKH